MVNGQLGRLLRQVSPGRTVEQLTDGQLLERFARRRDESAFAVLVKRHGPMVLAVCRRLLQNAHDADDAFQATFLVLVRKAGLIAQPELLANWLYGVAYRVAIKARVRAARRSEHERRAPAMSLEDPLAEVSGRELRSVLDAEMNHLPEKYRAPLVLCYLEGKTNEEAARQLGWPTGSISGRLARARELLRKRLVRRGLVLSAGGFAMLLSHSSASAAVPQTLFDCTVRGAILFTQPAPVAASAISPSVSTLADEVLEVLRFGTVKKKLAQLFALILIILLGLAAVAVAYAAQHTGVHCS
jgi:RNA polymerase sigma factor (sigma-70 family)